MISSYKENTNIKEKLLVINSVKGIVNGKPYLNIVLQDASGQIEGRKWDAVDNDTQIFATGNFVEIEASVILYRANLQLKIISGRVLDESEYNKVDFTASSPVSKERLQKLLGHFLEDIENPEIKKVLEDILRTDLVSFMVYPAATRNHHEYLSGLLHHTVGMLQAAEALLNVYPTLNKDYLYSGIILHDLGKLVELSDAVLPKYTTAGKLLGHISIMQARVSEVCKRLGISDDVAIVLQHMVLSHHGEKEFGSPVVPLTKEAEVLSMLDNLDARINMIDKAIKEVPEGEFSQRIMALDGRAFYKPKALKKD